MHGKNVLDRVRVTYDGLLIDASHLPTVEVVGRTAGRLLIQDIRYGRKLLRFEVPTKRKETESAPGTRPLAPISDPKQGNQNRSMQSDLSHRVDTSNSLAVAMRFLTFGLALSTTSS